MEKRYTIFISSTFKDLKEERDAVTKAVMQIGHIPLGMEAFGAADASQWEIIMDSIDKADCYILIIGNRYGSVDEETGMSYTEKEFRYAKEKGIPCLVFPIHHEARILLEYIDNPEKVKEFKNFALQGKQAAFWTSPEDLALKVNAALTQEFHRTPRPGWIRPPRSVSPEVTEQLARIIKEKDELQKEVQRLRNHNIKPKLDVQFSDTGGVLLGRAIHLAQTSDAVLKSLRPDTRQHTFLHNYKEVKCIVRNVSGAAAEDLDISFETASGIEAFLGTLKDFEYFKSYYLDCIEESDNYVIYSRYGALTELDMDASLRLVSPEQTVEVHSLVIVLPDETANAKIKVRITGRNLPEAQEFLLSINVGESTKPLSKK